MTSLSFSDIFNNAMHFDRHDGLLYRTAVRFSLLFQQEKIRYYIVEKVCQVSSIFCSYNNDYTYDFLEIFRYLLVLDIKKY